ncbi:hypothetical protein K504DRAFT_275452 [Pleomassaria siparia CBS 279.74]|uniref:Uncharacterized protein n=1 Tax=Pleomassaria siparia CBS 279.74 TaxID=1314801 RepID=A0A6G1KAL4_9PLEO|nr:hypothetical protein K504DRAFT_275452 [Pleomassaria siparia CBS 279.74]
MVAKMRMHNKSDPDDATFEILYRASYPALALLEASWGPHTQSRYSLFPIDCFFLLLASSSHLRLRILILAPHRHHVGTTYTSHLGHRRLFRSHIRNHILDSLQTRLISFVFCFSSTFFLIYRLVLETGHVTFHTSTRWNSNMPSRYLLQAVQKALRDNGFLLAAAEVLRYSSDIRWLFGSKASLYALSLFGAADRMICMTRKHGSHMRRCFRAFLDRRSSVCFDRLRHLTRPRSLASNCSFPRLLWVTGDAFAHVAHRLLARGAVRRARLDRIQSHRHLRSLGQSDVSDQLVDRARSGEPVLRNAEP